MAKILYLGTAGSDDLTRAGFPFVTPKIFAEKVAATDKVVST